MIVILLGLLDIVAGLTMFSLKFSTFLTPLAWIFTIIIFGRSLLYIKSFASVVDIIVSIIFIFSLIGFYNIATYIGIIWLIQKGVVSFL